MADNDITSLAYCVLQTYKDFASNRRDLADKWQRNLNAFRRINNGSWKDGEADDWQSDAFDAITKQKIMAAISVCIDSYLSGGLVPFDLKPAPLELEMWDEAAESLEDLEDEIREMIEDRLNTMRKRIKHQFELCGAENATIRHFLSGAIYGSTYAKTCVEPYVNRYYAPIPGTVSPSGQHVRYEPVFEQEEAPSWKYVTPWDIFTDYEETDLKKCHAVIHRQMLSPFQLVEMLKGKPGVFDDELRKALKDHENKSDPDSTAELPPALRDVPNKKQNVRYIEYWGRIPRSVVDEFEPAGGGEMWTLEAADDDEQEGDMIECLVGVVGDTVVRLAITGDATVRPFFCAHWEDNFDGQGGIGIADNTEDVQKLRNGAIRMFFDNKALSANVMFAVKREMLAPNVRKELKFKPGMTIDIDEECQDARQAIQQFTVHDVGESLISMLHFTSQWADDDSMVPKIQQGGEGRSSETAFELSQRLEKSGKYLARVMRNYDNGLTEPIARWFYDWNMEDPAADGKGSYDVIATGFTSFQNRLEKLTAIRELLQVAMMLPEGNIKLMEIFKEIAKMSDVDPDQFIVSEQEAEEQGPNPVQEAELRKLESEIARNEAAAQKSAADAQIAAERLKLEQVRAIEGE